MLPSIGLRLAQSRLLRLDAVLLCLHSCLLGLFTILLRLDTILLRLDAVLLRLHACLLGLFTRLSFLRRFHTRLRRSVGLWLILACRRLDAWRLRRPHAHRGRAGDDTQHGHAHEPHTACGPFPIQQHDPLLQWVGCSPMAGHGNGLQRQGCIEHRVGIATA